MVEDPNGMEMISPLMDRVMYREPSRATYPPAPWKRPPEKRASTALFS
jgi:hypothetical protein